MIPGQAKRRVRIRAELPISAALPRTEHAQLGLRNLVARAGATPTETVVTLLDTEDHRLIRAGLLLAHRVSAGTGEWCLTVPEWVDLEVADTEPPARRDQHDIRIPLTDDGDLPAEIQRVVIPFRRLAPLGPVAALTIEHSDYGLRDNDNTELGTLHDERITIRRGGMTTARYREISVTSHKKRGFPACVNDWLTEALALTGATVLTEFPTVAQRLGAPATGPSDVPDPAELRGETFAGFVAQLLARALRTLTIGTEPHELPLPGRGSGTQAGARIIGPSQAQRGARWLNDDLAVLGPALDPRWVGELRGELEWYAETGNSADSERYRGLLELLVQGIRSPGIADGLPEEAAAVLTRLVDAAVSAALRAVDALHTDDDDVRWHTAIRGTRRAVGAAELAARAGVKSRKYVKRLRRLHDQLLGCHDPEADSLVTRAEAVPTEAFELGREYERRQQRILRRRKRFIAGRSELVARLGK